ncbi:hypothetical protein [uncultured Roseobacter sp.]|uniref:hypothetical protein n=1 Tax=uncultured Roseobacter sp. TaxID=114847 RepID=UPI0026357B55|nr:hypothetical protein [uncultured Roseobacter sp.]
MSVTPLSLRNRPSAPAFYPLLVIVLVALLYTAAASVDDARQGALMQESGLLEIASGLIYLPVIALLLRHRRLLWPFIVLLVMFCLREFDMDKRLFTEGLFKSRQYIGGGAGLPEKLISAVILGGFVVSLWLVIWRGRRGLLRRLVQGDGVALCVVLGGILAVTSKTTDGLGRKLAEFDIIISRDLHLAALTYEEVAEFGMGLSLLLAALIFTRQMAATGTQRELGEVTG